MKVKVRVCHYPELPSAVQAILEAHRASSWGKGQCPRYMMPIWDVERMQNIMKEEVGALEAPKRTSRW